MRVPVLLLAVLGLLVPGITARGEPEGTLRVGAAASLREPFTRIAEAFTKAGGPPVTLAFGASSALAVQARAGAPLDVLASADERTVEALEQDGLAAQEDRTVFASNRLVVLVSPALQEKLRAPADLAGPALRHFALPPDAVPAGHYARAWLRRVGLLAVLEPRFVSTGDVRAALAAVEAGHADAAIVYATDARHARHAVEPFGIPEEAQPAIVYAATRLLGSERSAAAGRFLAFLRGPAAAAALRDAGFGAAPAAPGRP